jgi:tetratricopeptide (TPR) repeat protein
MAGSLMTDNAAPEPVLGEAMKPFLQYGWQPQVMAVAERTKVIRSGALEVYDLATDPGERHDLGDAVPLDRALREALRVYPFVPEPMSAPAPGALSQEDRERLASLGYVGWEGRTALRDDAPSPRERVQLFAQLDLGSGLFVRQRYREAIEVFEEVFEEDPHNLMVAVRLAVAHSVLGHDREALAYFERARRIDPASVDVRHYLALHHCRRGEWAQAEPLAASVVAQQPERVAAVECLADVRRAEGRLPEAAALLEGAIARQSRPGEALAALGELRMQMQDTPGAIRAFERALAEQGDAFDHHLDLGVCYLADRRVPEARDQLDQVAADHPAYPLALFKRAQVSVLLAEPDQAERVRRAYAAADPELRQLIENEALFRGLPLR